MLKPIEKGTASGVKDSKAVSHASNHAYLPPDAEAASYKSKLRRLLAPAKRLMLFHLLNGALAVTAFCAVGTAASLSVCLIPLCGIGFVIFQALTRLVEWFARLDITINNLIIPAHEPKLGLHPSISCRATTAAGTTPWSRLVYASPGNVKAMLYFATIKFVVGLLSWCSLALPIHPIINNTGMWSDQDMYSVKYADQPALYVVLFVLSIVVGVALVPVVASASRKVTESAVGQRHTRAPVAPVDAAFAEPVDQVSPGTSYKK